LRALPLVPRALPALPTNTPLWLSIEQGVMKSSMHQLDGCVSISRAARHDLPNHIFRALVLPAALLQGMTWMLCAAWLKGMETETRTLLRILPWLGVLAALFLILYGTFLGTDGLAYRFMRRQGITFYFGFTYLCMVIASGALWRIAQARLVALPARLDLLLPGLCAFTLLMGLMSGFVPHFLDSEDLKDRVGNIFEWYAGLSFTLFFLALAWLWRRTRFSARFANRT
ncbi:MAG: hypothetical protein ACRD3R_10590, partial [Terriglobales bacterium]